ncbi:hypothetical protein [Arsenophonus sp. ENCA]|uniref:hypothetical protein n=1 Tax=Arsenophonus sp. ENCA TaxID=1987579 RepID=UPI0025C3B587|nr:hypothetical protein [Arsenophonus sp. ENCA]
MTKNASLYSATSLMIFSAELKTLIEKVHAERVPFSLMCNLPANFRKSPTVWQFHFLPLFCSENGYMGTFFHAHEFLFLSPLEYVDGMQPYFSRVSHKTNLGTLIKHGCAQQ